MSDRKSRFIKKWLNGADDHNKEVLVSMLYEKSISDVVVSVKYSGRLQFWEIRSFGRKWLYVVLSFDQLVNRINSIKNE